jgi:hypothetical protein
MNTKLHPQIQELENRFKTDAEVGVCITDYEKLYKYNLLYADALPRFHFLDEGRKALKDQLFLEYKKEYKTDKTAEAMARTDPQFTAIVEERRKVHKYYLQLKAQINFLEGKIKSDTSREISQNIEKRLSAPSGEGRN